MAERGGWDLWTLGLPVFLRLVDSISWAAVMVTQNSSPRWYDARVADLVGGLVARLDSLGFVERAAVVESDARGQVVDVTLATFETDEAPWRRIPASQGQDIARMWSQGVSAKKIGDNVGVSADRVHNIIARLRRDYGDDVASLRNPKVAKLVRSREKK